MRVGLSVVLLSLVVTLFASCAGSTGWHPVDRIYVCGCDTGCACGVVAQAPRKCACGKEMTSHRVLALDGTQAQLCGCSNECNCNPDAADPTRCSCGNKVLTVSLAGKGFYRCDCDIECSDCSGIAADPGECNCGKPLVKIE